MTGTTSELGLVTATDDTDVDVYGVITLTTNLTTIDGLFSATTGHDHSGLHKGKPIPGTALAAGAATGAVLGTDVVTLTGAQTLVNKTLTSPHMTGAVVDSGGLTITSGNLTLAAGNVAINATLLTTAALLSRGTTADTSAYALWTQDSTGANLLLVRNDGLTTVSKGGLTVTAGNVGINAAVSASAALLAKGTTSDSSAYALWTQKASGSNLMLVRNDGLVTLPAPPAFVASDKYLVISAAGDIHVSALGPAS